MIEKGTDSMTPKSGTTEYVSFAGDWLQKWRIGKNDFFDSTALSERDGSGSVI
jgi:hypothetical protein